MLHVYTLGPDGPEIEPIRPLVGICNEQPIEMRENDGCFSAGIASISTSGHDDRCCCWNFGWYGSNMRIFPQRLKNKAIAATHSSNTATTMSTSSGKKHKLLHACNWQEL